MTTTYYAALGGTRILNATLVDQSGADDGDVSGWVLTNDFAIALNINSGAKDTVSAQYRINWRVSGGSFAALAATGAMKFGATDLTNGSAIAVGGRKCDSQGGDTWQAGEEVEGTANSDAIDLADEYETEIHFSVSPADAADGALYEFELYDVTAGASRGTLGATLTTYAPPQGEVFADDFEDGTDNAWTSQAATPTVAVGNALASTSYGVGIDLSTTAEYESKTFATAITTGVARLRMYIDPAGITSPDASSLYVLTISNASGGAAYIHMEYSTSSFQIRGVLVDDAPSNQTTNWYPISTAEHYVEILVKRATTVSASDGYVQLWIDGVSKETISNLDNFDRWGSSLTYIRMGQTYYTGTAGGTFKVDELVVRDDDTEIGPVSGAYEKAGGSVVTAIGTGADVSEYVEGGGSVVTAIGTGADVSEFVEGGGSVATLAGTGASETSVLYEKAGGGVATLIGTGADVSEYVESGGGVATLIGTGADVSEYVESGGGVATLIGTGASDYTPAGGNTYEKAGGGVATLVGTGADVSEYVESGGGVATLIGTGASDYTPGAYEKAGGGVATLVGTGASETSVLYEKAGGSVVTSIGTGADVSEYVEGGGSVVTLVGTGISATGVLYEKAGGATTWAIGTGADVSEYVESGGGVVTLIGTGADVSEYVETGGGIATLIGTGADVSEYVETGGGVATLIGTGISFVGAYEKAGGSIVVLAGTGASVLIRPTKLTIESDTPETLTVEADTPETLTVEADTPETLTVEADTPETLTVEADTPATLTVEII